MPTAKFPVLLAYHHIPFKAELFSNPTLINEARSAVDTDALPLLEIRTLGTSSILVDGQEAPVPLSWKKYRALLTYLATAPKHTRLRKQTAAMFWPDVDPGRARHSFNEAMRRIRQVLGNNRFLPTPDDESVRLNPENLRIDIFEFRALANQNPLKALEMLEGDFLEGLAFGDSLEFEDWIALERESIRTQIITVLLNAAHLHASEKQLDLALRHAMAAHERAPFSERPAEVIMQIHALANRPRKALDFFESFKTTAWTEPVSESFAKLEALAEKIASGQWRNGILDRADFGPPLLDRRGECVKAFEATTAAQDQGPFVIIIEGAPGFGRTRLISECARRFQLQGGVAVMARPLAADIDVPWSTFRALARAGLATVTGKAGMEPRKLEILAGIAPEFSLDAAAKEPKDLKEVSDALVEFFKAITEEHPLLVAIDDANFADGETLNSLNDAITTLASAGALFRVSLILATNGDPDLDEKPLLSLQAAAGRTGVARVVRLPALSDEETESLVENLSTWHEGPDQRARIARRINFEAGGNPFLTVTLLRGLEHATSLRKDLEQWPVPDRTMEGPLPISMPDTARIAIVAQANSLERSTRDVLAAASVLGVEVNVPLLTHVLSDEVEDVEGELYTLERERFLTFNGERFAFAAPVLKEVCRRELLVRSKIRTVRGKAILWLEGRADLSAKVLHAELQAEEYPGRETLEEAVELARLAAGQSAWHAARRAGAIAARAARKMDPDESNPLLKEIDSLLR